jgi:hypothetical protein
MIDVHCPDSPTGRHEFKLSYYGFWYCEHCDWRPGLQLIRRWANSAMMLTADEAERYDSDEQLGNYARTWRGE